MKQQIFIKEKQTVAAYLLTLKFLSGVEPSSSLLKMPRNTLNIPAVRIPGHGSLLNISRCVHFSKENLEKCISNYDLILIFFIL